MRLPCGHFSVRPLSILLPLTYALGPGHMLKLPDVPAAGGRVQQALPKEVPQACMAASPSRDILHSVAATRCSDGNMQDMVQRLLQDNAKLLQRLG